MGRDKAMLPFGEAPLVDHVARMVKAASGTATLVGPRERYGHLGWPLVEDDPPGDGPLGGIIAALAHSASDRCLIVACDMPWLDRENLQSMVEHVTEAEVLVARGENGVEPLCAVYRRSSLPVLRAALQEGDRTVRRVIGRLRTEEWPVSDVRLVFNANTPADWATVEAGG